MEEEETRDLFAKVDKNTKDLIEQIKERIREQDDERRATLGTAINQIVSFYEKLNIANPDVKKIIDKYSDDYKDEADLLTDALRIFDTYKRKRLDLWLAASEELRMMLIGPTTFRNLLYAADAPKKSLDKPQRENNALDVILWYTKKPITMLSLEEILYAIKDIWTVFNFFSSIEITKQSRDTYYIRFLHSEDERYSRYYLGYFERLFYYLNASKDVPFKCGFDGQAFGQTVSINVRELFDREI
ncbi:MAG: hypothetical protein GF353_11140 [Candidatus Lokiarchaeota archaeon]|nr:hypothetical protein [Candidatus Lokiarchaeota archaeon]